MGVEKGGEEGEEEGGRRESAGVREGGRRVSSV